MAMQSVKIKILEVKTSVEKDAYRSSKNINGTIFSDPKNFVLDVVAELNGEKAYFSHRLAFGDCIGEFGQVWCPDKDETDFLLYQENVNQKLVGGHQMDKNYIISTGKIVPKIAEGQEIKVRCQVEEKISRIGNKYYQLKRVKLDKAG